MLNPLNPGPAIYTKPLRLFILPSLSQILPEPHAIYFGQTIKTQEVVSLVYLSVAITQCALNLNLRHDLGLNA